MSPPIVCGAIGDWDQRTFDQLSAACGKPPIVGSAAEQAPRWVLASSGRLAAWQSGRQRGWSWASLAPGSTPTSWRDAATDGLACGLALDERVVRLHGDALGMGRLYVRTVGSAVYFSNRIRPLATIGAPGLTVDVDAWSSILTLGAPLADATPFVEVRRVDAATSWVSDGGRLTTERFDPFVEGADPPCGAPSVSELVDAVAAAIPPSSWRRPLHVTLSGGWDSRLLAGLITRASSRWVTAWTTSPDDGYDLDVELARPVAAAMSLRQREILPAQEAWVQSIDTARRRVEHQTWLHTWLVPLAERMHRRRGVVVDGLAGDVLFKGLFVDAAVLAGESAEERRRLLWHRLGGERVHRGKLLAAPAASAMTAASWRAYLDATARLHGHRAELPASVLVTRTARVIAFSPLDLFGPECAVSLPFLSPDVVRLGLRIGAEQKLDGELYRALLRSASPAAAGLPSTNDVAPGQRGSRRQTTALAVHSLVTSIRSQPAVLGLVGPGLQHIVEAVEPATVLGTDVGRLAVLQGLATLADWLTEYERVLAPPDLSAWWR